MEDTNINIPFKNISIKERLNKNIHIFNKIDKLINTMLNDGQDIYDIKKALTDEINEITRIYEK